MTDIHRQPRVPAPSTLNDPFVVGPMHRHTAGPNKLHPGIDLALFEALRDPEEEAWDLIGDLMADLPGPDGWSAPLGITWQSGEVAGAPFWREHFADFRFPILHNADFANDALRAVLWLSVARLRTLGERMGLGPGMVSRLVYDFLTSVVYACEAQS